MVSEEGVCWGIALGVKFDFHILGHYGEGLTIHAFHEGSYTVKLRKETSLMQEGYIVTVLVKESHELQVKRLQGRISSDLF